MFAVSKLLFVQWRRILPTFIGFFYAYLKNIDKGGCLSHFFSVLPLMSNSFDERDMAAVLFFSAKTSKLLLNEKNRTITSCNKRV
jgi:hypothetical protein